MERKSRGCKTGNDAKASAGTQISPNCKKFFKRLGQHRCQPSSATTPVKKKNPRTAGLDAKKTDTKASVGRQRDRETRPKTAEEQRFDGHRSALTTRRQHEGIINADSQGGARPKVKVQQSLSRPPLSSTERRGSRRNPNPASKPLQDSHDREPTTPEKKEPPLVAGLEAPGDKRKTDKKARALRFLWSLSAMFTYFTKASFGGQTSKCLQRNKCRKADGEMRAETEEQDGARPKVKAKQPHSRPALSSTECRGVGTNPNPPSKPLQDSHGREPTTPEKKEPPAVAVLEAPDDEKKTDTKARALRFLRLLSAMFSYLKKILQKLYGREGEGSVNADSQGGARPKVPVLDVTALTEEAEKVMEKLKLEANSNPLHNNTTFFDDQVKVKRHEKEAVAGAFNPFRERIKKCLNESTEWTWKEFNSGSTYDGTKVARADEVDCMFIPNLPGDCLNMIYKGAPPGFCFVELKLPAGAVPPGHKALQGLCRDGRVSSALFRQKVFKVFKDAVEKERRATVNPDSKAGSPAFAVQFLALPSQEGEMKPVFIDLVPAIHLNGWPPESEKNLRNIPGEDASCIQREGFHVIPKEYHGAGYRNVRHLLWRLSFSRAEKQLTQFADKRLSADECPDGKRGPVTCRKRVLRVLKRMLEIMKGFDNSRESKRNPTMRQLQAAAEYLIKTRGRDGQIEKFTTFQVRTLMWTEFYVTCPGNEKWLTASFRSRLMDALIQMKNMLSGKMRVEHFFLPDLDIMDEVPRHEREFLYIMFCISQRLF